MRAPFAFKTWSIAGAIESARSNSGAGLFSNGGFSGTVFHLKRVRTKTSGRHPFLLINASTEATKKIRVLYGTVAGEAPVGMSPGDQPPYVLSVIGGTGYVYLVVSTNGETGVVTSRSIGIGASVPNDGDGLYHLEIGSYSVVGDKLNLGQALSGSQAFELCGGPGGEPTWGLL